MGFLNKFTLSFVLFIICIAAILWNNIFANTTTTHTSLWITAGVLSFYKDTTTAMNGYFGWSSPNTASSIDIGTYSASLTQISASSDPDHRFTVSDMLWEAFTVTIQSSAMTSLDGTIPAANIWYTGTNREGTWAALTAEPTWAVDIGTAPVTFVSRNNADGLSVFAQEITLTVNVPAAQTPGSYTGLITFTY